MKRRGKLQRPNPAAAAQRATSQRRGATKRRRSQRVAWHWPTILAGGLLVAMVLATYAPVVVNQYIWDDEAYVTNNLTIRSLPGLWSMWFRPYSLPQYYPLVHTTYWLEYHLWGLHPLGYHVVNVLLHATCVILAWRLLARLRVPGAWLGAAIFAVHPITVESVAWITERKNVLSLPLALGSMLCYLRFAPADPSEAESTSNKARHAYYALALALFLAALLSKTVVASLPAVLLVIYWWKRGKISWSDVRPLAPFFAVGIGMGVCTALLERYHVGAMGEEWDFTPADRILIAGRAVWFYAGKLVWPHPIIFIYPRWELDDTAWWQYLYPAAAVALLAGLWFARRRIGRGPLAAALIFGGVLLPALGFLNVFPFKFSFVADHFQHQASLAMIALFAAGLVLAARRFCASTEQAAAADAASAPAAPSVRKFATVTTAGALLAVLAIISFRQTFVYYDVHTLYKDIIEKNPEAWVAYSNLGGQFFFEENEEEALGYLREALRINPSLYRTHTIYAGTLLNLGARRGFEPGQMEEAIEHFAEAMILKPDWTPARVGLARAFVHQGRIDEARDQLNLALEHRPRSLIALLAMGGLKVKEENWPEAQQYFERAVAVKPDRVEGYQGAGHALVNQGKSREAIPYLTAVVQINPESSEARYNLGNASLNVTNFRAAAEQYREALRIKPDYLEALSNLGVAYGQMGNVDGAVDCFERIIRIDPNFNGAKTNLKHAQDMKQQPP